MRSDNKEVMAASNQEDVLQWLCCVVPEVKRFAPTATTETLFKALKVARKNREIGKMKILCRELFFRLEPGDKVYTVPFDCEAEPSADWKIDEVLEWTKSGKLVHLKDVGGCWGWDDVQIIRNAGNKPEAL